MNSPLKTKLTRDEAKHFFEIFVFSVVFFVAGLIFSAIGYQNKIKSQKKFIFGGNVYKCEKQKVGY